MINKVLIVVAVLFIQVVLSSSLCHSSTKTILSGCIHSINNIPYHHPRRSILQFTKRQQSPRQFQLNLSSPSPPSSSSMDDLSEEDRRTTIFQNLLRDLQNEGVPLLGCDVDAVHTMNAALWTTMSELSLQNDARKSCLIMERIPLPALQAFVNDFNALKSQTRLLTQLPELQRIHVSMVGNGIGPALSIQTTERTPLELEQYLERSAIEETLNEAKCTEALRSFITRIVIDAETCPYTRTPDHAATGLLKKGITPGPVAYRFSSSSDACAVLGTFWNTVCELLSTPQEQLSTTMLSLPAIGVGDTDEAHSRFVAVVELIGRNLCLFRGDGAFGLVHFHPAYDRAKVFPVDKPAYGHLPPRGWLRAMLRMNGNGDAAERFTDEELAMSDFQRRAPFTAINVLRAGQLDAAAGKYSIVNLDLGGGRLEKASGIQTYSRNVMRLVSLGEDLLQDGVHHDMAKAYY